MLNNVINKGIIPYSRERVQPLMRNTGRLADVSNCKRFRSYNIHSSK